ncbi:VirB4 family type IV secretion system protein [Bacillus salitolerans]|uniref:VirB4 family type IV secretion system protein n=1 Tax=Bacillus salitolerans TaxID=1437434 RepID=A0ABW4LM69_9BACI
MNLLKAKKKTTSKVAKKPQKRQAKKSNTTSQETPTQVEMTGNFWDIISPDGISITNDDFGKIKQSLGTETYFRPFYLSRDGYPRKMRTNWLYSLTSSGEIDVMLHLSKIPKNEAIRMLQKQITMLKSNLTFQVKRGNIDQIQDLQNKIADSEVLMGELQFSENDLYHVGTLGTLYGQSEKEINRYAEAIEDEMSGMFFKVVSTWGRVKKGFRSVLPLGLNEIPDSYRNIDRRALSTFAPFISGSKPFHGGIPIGINKITGQKEFIQAFETDEHKPKNMNMTILGVTGSGKSVAMKLLIAREMTGNNVYSRIIDVENEFSRVTKRLGGINLNISEESDIRINPLAINFTDVAIDDEDEDELQWLEESDDKEIIEKDGKKYYRFVPLREKRNDALNFFDILMRGKNQEEEGLNVFERNFLEEALKYVYEEDKKITVHPSSLFESIPKEIDGKIIQSQVKKPEPTISDVYKYLIDRYSNEYKCERLIAAIRPFLHDGSKPIFDGQTYLGKGVTQSLNQSRIVNFNISGMEEGFLRPLAYHVILNYLFEDFVKDPSMGTKRKIVYCDEAWTLVDNDQTVSFLEKMARRSRKRQAGLRIASQDFVRLIENPKSRGIIQNCYSFMFFQQNSIDRQLIKDNFPLSDGELQILFSSNLDKGEGILREGGSSVWFRTDPSEDEMVFIESNTAVLEEMLKKRKMMARR